VAASNASGRVGSHVRRADNCLKHRIDFAIDLMIPKPQDLVTCTLETLVSRSILRGMHLKCMLSTVHLYDKAGATALEIDDVSENRRLPAEVKTERPQFAQADPELDLLGRHRLPQSSRLFARHGPTRPPSPGFRRGMVGRIRGDDNYRRYIRLG